MYFASHYARFRLVLNDSFDRRHCPTSHYTVTALTHRSTSGTKQRLRRHEQNDFGGVFSSIVEIPYLTVDDYNNDVREHTRTQPQDPRLTYWPSLFFLRNSNTQATAFETYLPKNSSPTRLVLVALSLTRTHSVKLYRCFAYAPPPKKCISGSTTDIHTYVHRRTYNMSREWESPHIDLWQFFDENSRNVVAPPWHTLYVPYINIPTRESSTVSHCPLKLPKRLRKYIQVPWPSLVSHDIAALKSR